MVNSTAKTVHRNSPARAEMLAKRAEEQRSRTADVTLTFFRDGKWLSEKHEQPTRMQGVPASINRRTGEPHKHPRRSATLAA